MGEKGGALLIGKAESPVLEAGEDKKGEGGKEELLEFSVLHWWQLRWGSREKQGLTFEATRSLL